MFSIPVPRGPRVLSVGELVLWYGMFAPNGRKFRDHRLCPLGSISVFHRYGLLIDLFLSFFNPLKEHLGTNRVEGTAFTTFGHDPGSLFGSQPPELYIFDHLSDEIE